MQVSQQWQMWLIHTTNCHIRCAVCVFHHIFSFFLQYIYSIETEYIETESTHNSFRFPDIKKRARGTERETTDNEKVFENHDHDRVEFNSGGTMATDLEFYERTFN